MCRKIHGAAFGTYVVAAAEGFGFARGESQIAFHASSKGNRRAFCPTCGSLVPGEAREGRVAMPAGCLDDDPGVRPLAHIFVASRPAWSFFDDAVPAFDTTPPGFDIPAQPDPPAWGEPGGVRGSCLCRAVRYRLESSPTLARHCHCRRCRKARSAAHTTNLFLEAAGVRFEAGEDRVRTYKLPEARYFAVAFCEICSSGVPRISAERGIAVVPMGGLDDDPVIRPASHIYTGSKAPWHEIRDGLTVHEAGDI